ncbi:hypothetical protein [Amycolatopsis taiwanensis]|uniref:Uncharacterized protein n=1 Tax=Amycolatopsis taiwanensis TaxID=342230 RepID=A0A9W6QXQ1_9PSEU|nr:hypothetical protein [Amycolatopsis taiwanensis]GLY64800.1 hypothetical protein Atai01_14190 [Amycolatopsis taiwanensis]
MNTEPFTAVVCQGTACGHEHGRSVVDGLRGCVRRQRHGVLVSTGCLLGRLGCHALGRSARPAGALLVVQPCSVDRQPFGLPIWIGPLSGEDDLAAVRRWLDTAHLDPARLPAGLRFRAALAGRATTN